MSSISSCLLDIFFPAACISCGEDVRAVHLFPGLCNVCHANISSESEKELFPVPGVDALYAFARFQGPVRNLIHRFKYEGKEQLGGKFAEAWLRATPFERSNVDVVIAVPMSRWKRVYRGFNPAESLARRIAQNWGVPYVGGILARRWLSRSQTDLNRRARFKNAECSFTLKYRGGMLRGASLLLVDDVCTTGATLSACAQLLKKAGARHVLAAAAAREIS